MQHSPHLIPTLEWSNESFENAKFDSPSPSPMRLRTTDLISNFSDLNDKYFYDEPMDEKVTLRDGIKLDETIDTITINDSTITINDSTIDTIIIPDSQPFESYSCQDLAQMNSEEMPEFDEEGKSWITLQPPSAKLIPHEGIFLYGKKTYPSEDKENEQPTDDSIPCGQNQHSTPLAQLYGNTFIDGIENAPVVNRKLSSKEPLARRLFF